MISSILLHDAYKSDHRRQYPEGTQYVYSNLTPRISRLPGIDHIVVFGIQYFVTEYLRTRFSKTFFERPKHDVVKEYQKRMDSVLGPNDVGTKHIAALHDLGCLPLHVKALPEGTLCPLRVPVLTITNTRPDFAWLPNFIETLLSNVLWHPMTSATIAFEYRKLLTKYAMATSDQPDFVKWQGHDFSMRGHSSLESSLVSGAAHMLSFTGTDTIPAIDWLEHHYYADPATELVGGSVPATEHSVMCLGGQETEINTYRRLLEEVYPKGIVSIVSDTWDYWSVLSNTLPLLKEAIMNRDGKLVVRPDSGDPELILCGDPKASDERVRKGTLQLLWETFGGSHNARGYRQLDPHLGVIYGDSITLERAASILKNMKEQGFASTNVVFGIGSYTYQYVTRDTFGFAMKATHGVINDIPMDVHKDPLTDGGFKKSARGLLCVDTDENGKLKLEECVTSQREGQGLLKTVFLNGMTPHQETLSQIRARLESQLKALL